jgi:hypothetical protein
MHNSQLTTDIFVNSRFVTLQSMLFKSLKQTHNALIFYFTPRLNDYLYMRMFNESVETCDS